MFGCSKDPFKDKSSKYKSDIVSEGEYQKIVKPNFNFSYSKLGLHCKVNKKKLKKKKKKKKY